MSETIKEAVCEAIAESLGEAYDCTRVWAAWGCGTMGPDDFVLVAEDDARVSEIADATLNAIAPEIDRLRAQVANLLNGEMPVCGDCDGSGWRYNRVDGRYPCTCMTEAGPYQLLEAQVAELTQDREALQDAIKTVSGEDETGINYLVAAVLDTGRERDDLYVEVQQARQETAREICRKINGEWSCYSDDELIDVIKAKYGIKEDI